MDESSSEHAETDAGTDRPNSVEDDVNIVDMSVTPNEPSFSQTITERPVKEVEDNDSLVRRLIHRIAELEEKLYQNELDAPTLPSSRGGNILHAAQEKLIDKPVEKISSLLRIGSKRGDGPKLSFLSPLNFSFGRKAAPNIDEPPSPRCRDGTPTPEDSFVESRVLETLRMRATSESGSEPSDSCAMHGNNYYRYVFDPADIAAEMEVTAKVRRAAAEALAEAEGRLKQAEASQRDLQRQLSEAKIIAKEVDRLKAENSATLAMKRKLEDDIAATQAELESMRVQASSVNEELESVRSQAAIWRSANSDETEKVKAENALIRNQMSTRLADLTTTKAKLAESEAERARLVRERADVMEKMEKMQGLQAQLESVSQQLAIHSHAAADWQDKFMKERNVRRKLHEQLQVLKGNIRVLVRVRPPLPGQKSVATYPLDGLIAISPPEKRTMEFEFDSVFSPQSSQAAVFEEVAPLMRSCADGFNVCIFAYGQTGSGKTHTMEGPVDDPGINVRALQELFRIAEEEAQSGGSWSVLVSMLEIYNEQVHDLLWPGHDGVKVVDVSGLGAGELPQGVDRVTGATWRSVTGLPDIRRVLKDGWKNRTTASTAMNAHSSRSHALLAVKVVHTRADGSVQMSHLNLVDLAGSERVDKSGVSGQQLKEAQAINKSLAALGDVISALQRRNAHIPFRNSKLTQVLCDSLSGSSKVLLVANISPEPSSSPETLCSLNFASRAAQVELGQAKRAGAGAGAAPAEKVLEAKEKSQAPVSPSSRLRTQLDPGVRKSTSGQNLRP